MTDPVKPNLYRGQPLSLGALSSDSFEDFVYQVLCEVAPLHGFKIVGGPQNSSDAGFDAMGERITDKAILCVQCKRLNSAMGLPVVATELAKVALHSALKNSNVRGHLIITSGTLTGDLKTVLREHGRSRLVSAAREATKTDDHLKVLVAECKLKGIDPLGVAESYVKGLDFLEVWSGRDFENQVVRVYSKLTDALERNFALETVVREEPRPDFDRTTYLKKITDSVHHVVELLAVRSELPPNVKLFPPGDPTAQMRSMAPPVTGGAAVVEVSEILKCVALGWASVLCGVGGSGKSTTLAYLGSEVAKLSATLEDAPLPILVHLGGYEGKLQDLIHQTLNVTRGHWKSLPGSFLLLCDGVDEIPGGKALAFFTELRQLLLDYPVQALVTMRSSGLRQVVCCDRLHGSWRLLPFTVRSALLVAEKLIEKPSKRSDFMRIFRERLTQIDPEILLLPFGFTSAVASFKKTGTIPTSTAELVSTIVTTRLEHNRTRDNSLEERLREVPDGTIRRLGEEICFELRIVKQKTLINEEEGQRIVSSALKRVQASGAFGSASLSESDALKLARHFEVFEPVAGGLMRAGHDLVADYLAAPVLAREWQQHLPHLQSTIAEDTWVFAGASIAEPESVEFIEAIAKVDLILAARCALTTGASAMSTVERLVFELDDRKTIYSSGIAAIAMSILKTGPALARLRGRLAETSGDRTFQGERALAAIGDRAVLRTILENEDPSASSGLKISGGHIGMWEESGSPVVTLELARERVKAATVSRDERICLSLRTISRYGDLSDIEMVESIALQTENLPTFYDAIYCLRALTEEKCIEVLRKVAADEKRGLQLIALEALSAYGEELETSGLVKALLEFKGDRGEAHDNIRRVLRIIKENPLPADAETMLMTAYPDAEEYLKADIWAIAKAHTLASFDELAFKILEDGNLAELGYAANHASVRFITGEVMERFAKLCEQSLVGLEKNVVGNGWHVRRLYQYLLQIDRKAVVASSVERILRRYLPEHHRLNREKDQSPQKAFQPSQDHAVLQYDFFVEHDLREYVCVAADVADQISHDVIRQAVGFRLWLAGKDMLEPYAKLMAQLSQEDLDRELSNISTSHDRICALGAVASLGATQVRREILIRDFPIVLHWHQAHGALAEALPVLWCREVAEAVVDAVSKQKWPRDFGAQLFTDVKVAVTRIMSREFAEEIVRPRIATTGDPASREILQYWYEAALARRLS